MRAREYDPESGRFLEVDPREAEAGESDLSSYLYAEDDPTLLTDPSGLDPRFEGKTLNCKKNKDLCGLIYRSGYKDNCNSYRLRKSLSNLYNDVGVEVTQIFLVATGKGRIFYNKLGSKGPGFYFARWGRGVTKIGHPRGETCGWRCSVGFFATQVLGCGSTVGCDVQGALFFVPGPSKGTALMKSSPWLQRALKLERVGVRAEKGARAVETAEEARSSVNAIRLASQLTREEATSIFTRTGGLRSDVIANSTRIINGNELRNRRLMKELTSQGGSISDWGKYATRTFRSPSGRFQVHFYYNPRIRTAYYGRDYKAVFSRVRR